jgi:hypothetical protein
MTAWGIGWTDLGRMINMRSARSLLSTHNTVSGSFLTVLELFAPYGSRAASLFRRLASLLVTFVFAVGLWATTAQAQTVHSLTGNARFQIGDGLPPGSEVPIPITFAPPPNGRVVAKPGATVVQTGGPDPKKMVFAPGQLTAPGIPVTIGRFPPAIFQVATNLAVQFPKTKVTFAAGGRTGPPVVTFCPGSVGTGGGFGCLTWSAGIIPGVMRYTATVAQFGGPGQAAIQGSADLAVRVAGTPPGVVTAVFARATPPPTLAAGGPFYWSNMAARAPFPPPQGFGRFVATANGLLTTTLYQHPSASGISNPVTSWAGPWTTGMLTVSLPFGSLFTLSGSDNRVNGVGNISLVSAAVSVRGLSGSTVDRGWLNLTVGPGTVPTPAISKGGLAAVFGLFALAGGYALRRRSKMR